MLQLFPSSKHISNFLNGQGHKCQESRPGRSPKQTGASPSKDKLMNMLIPNISQLYSIYDLSCKAACLRGPLISQARPPCHATLLHLPVDLSWEGIATPHKGINSKPACLKSSGTRQFHRQPSLGGRKVQRLCPDLIASVRMN